MNLEFRISLKSENTLQSVLQNNMDLVSSFKKWKKKFAGNSENLSAKRNFIVLL